MIKINWGQGIAIFFCLFVATLVTVLVKSRSVDHTLVYDDYYAKDISFQQRLDGEKNLKRDQAVAVKHDQTSNLLVIDFIALAKGELHLYRANDQSKDVKQSIQDSSMAIDLYALDSGKWTLILEWESDGVDYYYQDDIFI